MAVIQRATSYLKAKDLNVEGVALCGSRAKGAACETSDYDILVVSATVRSTHIEDILVDGHNVQLFILPFRSIDSFLLLNMVSDNGIMASMFNGYVVIEGSALLTRIQTNLSINLHSMDQVERNSVNRNLGRLRNRISKLIKDLNHSNSVEEDLYTGAELFKTTGQFLLAQKSSFFLPTEKHLYKELTKFYPAQAVKELGETYQRSVATADYSSLITICGKILQRASRIHSSSMSAMHLKANLGCNVIFVAAYNERLVHLVYDILKDNRPQFVLNQDRDLLNPGVYFIVDLPDFQEFLSRFKTLPFSKRDAESVTINYQLDYFLLEHFRRYNNDELLVTLSRFVMDNGMNRDIVMNSVLDWTLNSGIAIFSKLELKEYVQACNDLLIPSIPHDPETFDLKRVSERNSQLEHDLESLDLSSITERYHEAMSTWVCMDLADAGIRALIVETHEATLHKAVLHSAFMSNIESFSNFYHLFESVFNSTLLTHRERGLIYYSLGRILES